jgi:hypothetical protein
MLRLLAAIVLHLLANAAGLAIAAIVLEGFSIGATTFIVVVAVFSAIEFVLAPLVTKMSLQYAPALRGGLALVTTLVGLLVTTLLTDGLRIEGLSAWVVGTLIVWLGGVVAALVLPLFLFKKATSSRRGQPAGRA